MAAELTDERTKLRRQQSELVMPMIGPLLDAWEGLDNDTRSIIRDDSPGLARALSAITRAMEGHDPIPYEQLPTASKARMLIEELESESDRLTRFTNDSRDGLLDAAARMIETLLALEDGHTIVGWTNVTKAEYGHLRIPKRAIYTAPPPTAEVELPPMVVLLAGLGIRHLLSDDWLVPDDISARWSAWLNAHADDVQGMESLDEGQTLKAIDDAMAYLDRAALQSDQAQAGKGE